MPLNQLAGVRAMPCARESARHLDRLFSAQDRSFRSDLVPALETIFILSVLNAVERWYDTGGRIAPASLAERVFEFVYRALR